MPDKYRFDDSVDGKGKQKHVHLLNEKPLLGTSTVLNCLAKPLTWWAAGLAMNVFGWTPVNQKYWEDGKYKTKKAPVGPRLEAATKRFEEIKKLTYEEYLTLLDAGYKAHSVKLDTSADAGKTMHSELEEYVNTAMNDNEGRPYLAEDSESPAVMLFAKWAVENAKRFIASEAYCYSKKLWTGGIVDLVYMDKAGNYALLDFKSAQEAYHAHFLQNAGYDIAIQENGIFTKDGDLVRKITKPFHHYSVLPYGLPEPYVSHNEVSTADYKKGFQACVVMSKLLSKNV